jgi:hypothetical protein
MVWYVLLRPLRPELDGQQNPQIFRRTHMHGPFPEQLSLPIGS